MTKEIKQKIKTIPRKKTGKTFTKKQQEQINLERSTRLKFETTRSALGMSARLVNCPFR